MTHKRINKCVFPRINPNAYSNFTPNYYLYANRIILPENTEVVECFPPKTKNRLCIVNGFENATQNSFSLPPRYSLFDPLTGIQLYEIAEDVNGNKVICVKDECNARKLLVNTNPISLHLYDCLINDRNRYWQFDRRDIKASSLATTAKKRVLVQDSCHAKFLAPKTASCHKTSEYDRRRARNLNHTRFACNRKPVVNRRIA